MKQNLSFICNGILAVAVIVLFVLHFCDKSGSGKTAEAAGGTDSLKKTAGANELLPIAYVDVDSLLLNYAFAKEANENLLSKSQKDEARLRREMEQWQKEAIEFQQKAQTGSFLSKDRENQERARLAKRQQELENLQERLTKGLLAEQNKMTEQLKDSINTFMEEYNKTKKYQVIFSNTMNNNVLYSEKAYNITSEVIGLLNARYTQEKSSK